MKHDQLKQDIAEWQVRADAAEHIPVFNDPETIMGLFQEARTLLLRASESL